MLFLLFILAASTNFCLAQTSPYLDIECGMEATPPAGLSAPYQYGGAHKPERTNVYTGTNSNSVFRILTVFVQFPNDTIDPDNPNWIAGDDPTYMNYIFSEDRNNSYGSSWWSAYNETSQTVSDYWMEVTRGNFHVVSDCYSIQLDHPWYYYRDNDKVLRINSEIYDKLDENPNVLWTEYDNWTFKDGTYKYEKDKKIDMIYVVHRTYRDNLNWTAGSIAGLYSSLQGTSHVVSSGDTIRAGFGTFGSGAQYTNGKRCGGPCGPFSKSWFITVQAHELGHFFYGYGINSEPHSNYGIMMGTNRPFGVDSRFSPWEAIKLGYMTPINVTTTFADYSIGDFSSRDAATQGQVLQVPISGDTEFFLVALRNKISSYDRIMAGDTAHDDPFRVINTEYGKGVYIYHCNSGYNFSPEIDNECADGLWNWSVNGYFYPDWVNPSPPSQQLPNFVHSSVSYNNDNSTGGLNNRDEKGVSSSPYIGVWGTIGKRHTTLGGDGIDRNYTNLSEIWTSRSLLGDRRDAWRVGYNEVFSPYSSPSTRKWNNDTIGIFIWNYLESSNNAYFKVFKAGQGGFTRDSILHLTPPSKPMGIVVDYYLEGENIMRPLITWNHNMEPDMIRSDSTKRYKIWRATNTNMSLVPVNYTVLKTLDIHKNTSPSFIDTSIIALGSAWPGMGEQTEYPVRYRVQAIDNYGDSSVRSDFGSAIGLMNCTICEIGARIQLEEGEIPDKFKLYENYPNPFNPETKIKFDLPNDNFVSIKIYDVLGKEVATLVNEFKNAGSYIISFNGSNLSSGIYYYKIKAGSYEQIRKMILLK